MLRVESSFIREILKAAASPEVLSLAGGLPRGDLFPVAPFRAACDAVLTGESGARALQYTETGGEPELRAWIAERMMRTHGVPTVPEEVLVTTGSQQALDLCAKLLSDAPVGIEDPGYLGATLAFRANRVALIPVGTTAEGLVPEQVAATWRAGGQAIYGMSRFQNPRGGAYSTESREWLARSLAAAGTWFIEDDPYGELFLGAGGGGRDGSGGRDRSEGRDSTGTGLPPALIASLIPERVIYLGSFSKSVAPSLRIGFVRAPREIITALERIKQAADLHTSGFLQRALSEMLTRQDFDFDAHCALVRGAYREQRDALLHELAAQLPEVRCDAPPAGGMFLWAELPVSTHELFARALARGVAYVPGRHFYISKTPPDTGMRLNFSNLDSARMTTAVARLASALQEG